MWFGGKKQQEVQQAAGDICQWRHKAAHPLGGFNLSLGDTSDVQAITAAIFKQMGSKIMMGSIGSLLNFSKPITMSYEMSFLHSISNENIYCSLLDQAYTLKPEEQIKYVVAYLIGGLHANGPIINCRAPLDPLLGETLQLTKADGTTFYAEQTAFDPPCCHYQIIGQHYKIDGVSRLEINLHKTLNSLSVIQTGLTKVTFENGQTYVCQAPEMQITGLVMGERLMQFSGKSMILNQQESLKAQINFNYNPDGVMKKLTSFFKTQEKCKIFDLVEIDIIKTSTEDRKEEVLEQGVGSWLEDIKFQDSYLWKINGEVEQWVKQSDLLVSDSSNRQDLIFMLNTQFEEAQKAKLEMESQQKNDDTIRKQK